ncbi:MAG: GyrI-like domain-containing protein [Acidobacteriota bacterium]
MTRLEVRIVRLEPMRVASVRAVSETPERDAWEKMRAWAGPKGLLDDLAEHLVFGFNNPAPSQDRKDYGYELWIGVDPGIESEGEVEVKDFEGGLYAVTTCTLLGDPNVLETWKKLWEWVESSKFKWRHTHELEKALDPHAPEEDLVLDLYLPIEG